MKRDDSEIIEVFETDAPGFGPDPAQIDAAQSDSEDDRVSGRTNRPRWIVAAGAAAVAAFVAISATGGSPAPEQPRAAATTSTEAFDFVTVVPSPAEQAAANLPEVAPRYAIVNPPGYTTVAAEEYTTGIDSNFRSRVWATSGSTGSSGQWVGAIEYRSAVGETASSEFLQSSYRLAVGDSVAVVTPPTPASATTTAVLLGPVWIEMETFGLAADALPVLLETVATGLSATSTLDGYEIIADSPSPWNQLAGEGLSFQTVAKRFTTEPSWLSVITTRSRPNDSSVTDALPFVLDSMRAFRAADGSIGIAGYERRSGDAVAYWVDPDGWSVAVSFAATIDQVIATAQTAYRATDDEWAAFAAAPPTFQNDAAAYRETSRVVDTAAIDDALTLQTQLRQVTVGNRVRYSWVLEEISADDLGHYNAYSTTEFDDVFPTITTMSSAQTTTVLATLPRFESATADFFADSVLTVYPATGDPIVRAFADVDPVFSVLAATAIVEPIGAFTATITAADGTVLATWPTPTAG